MAEPRHGLFAGKMYAVADIKHDGTHVHGFLHGNIVSIQTHGNSEIYKHSFTTDHRRGLQPSGSITNKMGSSISH